MPSYTHSGGDCGPYREYPTIDDALGPASGRFLGEGHRRSRHQLRDLSLGTTRDGLCRLRVMGKADITYPDEGSREPATRVRRPHLNRFDAIVLSMAISEWTLTHALGLDGDRLRLAWIRSIKFRPSNLPMDELIGVDVSAVVVRAGPDWFSLCGDVCEIQCRIGTAKVILEIEYESVNSAAVRGGRPDSDVFEEGLRYYGSGYKETTREITDIGADFAVGDVRAVVTLTVPAMDRIEDGIGAAYYPCLSLIDDMAIMTQLARVILCDADTTDCDQASPLWLRHFSVTLGTPYRPARGPFVAALSMSRSRIATLVDRAIRMADLSCTAPGLTGTLSLMHQLGREGLGPKG